MGEDYTAIIQKWAMEQRKDISIKRKQMYIRRNDTQLLVELDLRYSRERSWLLDWKLMVLTVKTILRRDGE